MRPNSPPQITSVLSSRPRCLRSVSSAAVGWSVSPRSLRVVLAEVAVGVPLAVAINLDEPHAPLHQPAGQQALLAETARRLSLSRPYIARVDCGLLGKIDRLLRLRSACERPAHNSGSERSGRLRPDALARCSWFRRAPRSSIRAVCSISVMSVGSVEDSAAACRRNGTSFPGSRRAETRRPSSGGPPLLPYLF